MNKYIEFYGAIEELGDGTWAFATYGSNEPGEEKGDEAIESGIADSPSDAEESVIQALRGLIRDIA